jgi:cytochrome c oxidase subunit 2
MTDFLGLPLDASQHGHRIDEMLGVVHWLMLLLFVGWGLYFVYVLVRFRRSKNERANYSGVKSHFSTYIEVGVAIFEAVLLVGFAIPIWSSVVNAFPADKDATTVRVIAEQFAWNVHYPGADGVFGKTDIKLISAENPIGLDRNDPAAIDDITTVNQLNLPVGKPVIIYLTTKDVIHSFSIPFLRVKHDAIPGERIPVWFVPEKTSAEVARQLTGKYSIAGGRFPQQLAVMVSSLDYNAADGSAIVAAGSPITEDVIPELNAAGIQEVEARPEVPFEIACAQLCGLGHFRMRGFVTIQTQEEYSAWLAEQASYLEQ